MTRLVVTFDAEDLYWARAPRKQPAPDPCRLSAEGLEALLPVLERLAIRATVFCTGVFASVHPVLVRELHSRGHEVGSHGWDHRDSYRQLRHPEAVRRLEMSRVLLEDLLGVAVPGVRTPRLSPCPSATLAAAGFRYDASVQPTWASNLRARCVQPRRPWFDGTLVRVPLSTLPVLRLPLAWYVFRLIGPRFLVSLAPAAARDAPMIHLYFHPWEAAASVSSLRIHPLTVGCGPDWLRRPERLRAPLARRHRPATTRELAEPLMAETGLRSEEARPGGWSSREAGPAESTSPRGLRRRA